MKAADGTSTCSDIKSNGNIYMFLCFHYVAGHIKLKRGTLKPNTNAQLPEKEAIYIYISVYVISKLCGTVAL